jgi:hypothetical protein
VTINHTQNVAALPFAITKSVAIFKVLTPFDL